MTDCPRDRKILEGIDAGLFTASWWPFARLERADILSCLALWVCISSSTLLFRLTHMSNSFSSGMMVSSAASNPSEIILIGYNTCVETDAEVGPLAENFEAAQTFRETTIAYVKHCLKLSNGTEGVLNPLTKIVASFKAIGDAACEAYDLGKSSY